MSHSSAAVTRCMAEAADAAGRLIDAAVEHTLSQLEQAEVHAPPDQRQALAAAARALHVRRRDWAARFPALLRTAGEEQPGRAGSAGEQRTQESGFADLTLVDDGEIARKIESTRLAQELAARLERPLAELDGFMSSALGLPGIQPDRNPLRPAVYARVLRRLMEGQDIEPGWPALWLRHMVQPLAQQLEALYRQQVQHLREASVTAADYRLLTSAARVAPVASAPAPAAPAPAKAAAPAASARTSGFMDLPHLPAQAVDSLRLRLFLARDDPQARQPLAPGFRAQAEAELRALQQRSDERRYDGEAIRRQSSVPVMERAPRPVDTDSPLSESVWGAFGAAHQRSLVRGQLKAEARELGQVFGLEVVRRLINKVAEDPRLLGPVREAVVALEPSLSRLAMVAPRFFSDEAHPARLLVERVAERSLKFNDEFSVEFQAFLGPVAQTFTRLNDIERFDSPIPFQAALAALQAGWRAQDALDEQAQQRVLEAVQFAERRQREADAIAEGLRQREDLAHAPDAVRDFVLGPWCIVLAHARITRPQDGEDPEGRLAMLDELLWSVDREAPLNEPARAFVLIPRLLLQLRQGLASLGQPCPEGEAFFHVLEQLHRPVLKLRARQRQRELPVPQPEAAAPAPARHPDQPWMAPEELSAAGFEDTVASDYAGLTPAQRPLSAPADPLPEREVESMLAALGPGAWVDLYARQQWRRARLVWAAERGTLFMFVSHGGQPHCMSRRSLQRLARQQLLRALPADGVVPRALERLAQASAPMPLAA